MTKIHKDLNGCNFCGLDKFSIIFYIASNQMNKKLIIIILILFPAAIFGLWLLSQKGPEENRSNSQITVVSTIFPIFDITLNIAGDSVEVVQLLPSGASPHTYEPSVSDKRKVADADILFVIGLGLDDWAKQMAEGSDTKVVELYEGIELKGSEHIGHEDEHESEEDEDHVGKDPHYWLAVENAKIMAGKIYEELTEADQQHALYYENNLNIYLKRLDTLKSESATRLASLKNRELITFHDAFGYFAGEFDLEVVATIEPFAGKEPTPQYLENVGNIIDQYNIKVLFSEPQLSESIVEALAKDYGATVYTLDPIGGVEGRNSYEELIQYNVATVSQALGTI